MSNIKELIRAEIERRKNKSETIRERGAYLELLSFLDTLPDEPVSDCRDFKEAAEKSWVDYEYREDPRGLYSSCYIDGFIAGAEWMKTKMMEGAVEGVVCYGSKGAYIETDFLGEYDTDVYGNPGDKVRIIILPKEKDNDRTLV